MARHGGVTGATGVTGVRHGWLPGPICGLIDELKQLKTPLSALREPCRSRRPAAADLPNSSP
jgi:hypothetical protein